MTGRVLRGMRWAWASATLLMLVPAARGAEPLAELPPAIESIRVGLEGVYKVGYWTPVEVRLANPGSASVVGHVELILPDGDGTPSRVASPERVTLAAGEHAAVELYAKFGRLDSPLTVRFADERRVLAQREYQAGQTKEPSRFPTALPATDELYVSVGPSLGLPALAQASRRREQKVHVVELATPAALPHQWYGYEGVDAVLLATSEPGLYADLPPDGEQAEALRRWIRLGGRAVLSIGREAETVLAEGTLLGQLAPGRFAEMLPLRRSFMLENYAESKTPIETGRRRFRLDVPRLAEVRGRIEAYEGNRPEDLPLAVRAAYGFGEVVLIAVDLDQPPLAAWPGREALLSRLLARPRGESRLDASGTLGAVTTIGYQDLAGQLRAALEQFDAVTVVPFAVVGALAFAYLLLIGPLDYWLVKKVFRRMEATWITFSLLVIAVSVAAYVAAYALKGRQLRTNQVELVEFDLDSQLMRGTLWANLFSPSPESYDLSLAMDLPDRGEFPSPPQVLLSWMGLPGTALGGMQASSTNPPLFNQPYDFSPQLSALSDVPVQIWSTKGFTARWHAEAEMPLQAELTAGHDGMLTGRLANRTGLELIDARLHFDRWVYTIPRLRNGQSLAVGDQLQPLTSRTLLTRQRTVREKELREVATAYDAQTTDLARIMEIMAFYELAGGQRYAAGLTNRYQEFLDLSGHLTLGRAVLFARVATPMSTLAREGEPLAGPAHEQVTFYRFVIPVASESK